MVVGVAIENVAGSLHVIRRGKLDVDTVLLEEIGCFQSSCIRELAIIGPSRVKIGFRLGTLLKPTEDDDLALSDLESAHVEQSFGKAKLEQLPTILSFREAFDTGTRHQLA